MGLINYTKNFSFKSVSIPWIGVVGYIGIKPRKGSEDDALYYLLPACNAINRPLTSEDELEQLARSILFNKNKELIEKLVKRDRVKDPVYLAIPCFSKVYQLSRDEDFDKMIKEIESKYDELSKD